MAKKLAAKAKPASTKKSITTKKTAAEKAAATPKKAAATKPAAPVKAAKKPSAPKAKRAPTERVTGIGGIFFKSADPAKLCAWYKANLGIQVEAWGGASFEWIDPTLPMRAFHEGRARASTVWSPFEEKTTYFGPGPQPFMVNYRVRDLDAMLDQLKKAGVKLAKEHEESGFGRFAWGFDPEGNRFELWEPPSGM